MRPPFFPVRRDYKSLSSYFPKGTQFFYGYPSGDSSDFLNLVPPYVEELVAARVVCCAGNDVSPVCFKATTTHAIHSVTLDALGIPRESSKAVVLPDSIDVLLCGAERNAAVKEALKHMLRPKSFVMAQPYLDEELADFYQIKPSVTAYFNDKHNMPEYIGAQWLPKRLYAYDNGKAFAESKVKIALPAVIKVSASSSGDGVCICKKPSDVTKAIERLQYASGRIIVEEHIDFQKSYGVHFGIPADRKQPPDLIGVNEQIVTINGEFLGGIIEDFAVPPALEGAVDHLMRFILPRVRARGWHGIGGFDVLVDSHGKAFFIDANFRMTGMSAYHFMIHRGVIKRPMMSVLGEFEGSEEELLETLGRFANPMSNQRFLKLICLSRHENTWRFNGALEYTNELQLLERVKMLLDSGIRSSVLDAVLQTA
ncbi:ATP-grasp domain-containing protein [Candidatus Saccharibacteria bacterium]|nr:ATP-grasp domain-containing protein [Candidatus Saccharibacteria bacterium]